jgi:undecaprenyl pyrophosphate phosphatase UppP
VGKAGGRLAWFILLGTLPIAVCGVVFKRFIVGELRSLYVIAGSLISWEFFSGLRRSERHSVAK